MKKQEIRSFGIVYYDDNNNGKWFSDTEDYILCSEYAETATNAIWDYLVLYPDFLDNQKYIEVGEFDENDSLLGTETFEIEELTAILENIA